MGVDVDTKKEYWGELSRVALALAVNCSKVLKHNGNVHGNIIDGGELWHNPFHEPFDTPDEMELAPVDPYLARNLLVNLGAEYAEFRQITAWHELTKVHITKEIIDILHFVSHRRTFA